MPPTLFTLRPSFVEIGYKSVLSPHTMRIGIRQWNATSITGNMGSLNDWTETPRDAEEMIDDLVAAMAAVYPTTGSFTQATIWNYPTEANLAVPVASKSLAVAGTVAVPGQNGAVQKTFFFYDSNFKPFKLVLLDSASLNIWIRQTTLDAGAEHVAVAAEIMSDANGWQSRQNARPQYWQSVVNTLNKHLRAKYGYS